MAIKNAFAALAVIAVSALLVDQVSCTRKTVTVTVTKTVTASPVPTPPSYYGGYYPYQQPQSTLNYNIGIGGYPGANGGGVNPNPNNNMYSYPSSGGYPGANGGGINPNNNYFSSPQQGIPGANGGGMNPNSNNHYYYNFPGDDRPSGRAPSSPSSSPYDGSSGSVNNYYYYYLNGKRYIGRRNRGKSAASRGPYHQNENYPEHRYRGASAGAKAGAKAGGSGKSAPLKIVNKIYSTYLDNDSNEYQLADVGTSTAFGTGDKYRAASASASASANSALNGKRPAALISNADDELFNVDPELLSALSPAQLKDYYANFSGAGKAGAGASASASANANGFDGFANANANANAFGGSGIANANANANALGGSGLANANARANANGAPLRRL